MDQDKFTQLVQKIKDGTASEEEKLNVLQTLNNSSEELSKLLKELNQAIREN